MKKTMLLLAFASLTACVAKDDQAKTPITGMANPASVYCEKVGGRLDIVKKTSGEVGYCNLPNGERVDEWSLFRRDHQAGGDIARQRFL
ncbi:DUF333 domain-containing protein [Rouxiella badensis]|uniref:putative hemolysin n=1 Tax=Rouxiella badensis TaxID=1646377 RepID=UPI0013EF3BF0|nr:DUF333 domain-containing protein [Rouxiella badensis]QII37858.1 DUF333 domain-containing protein [Rouxiella badensis]